MSVEVVLELNADLSVRRLFTEERVFEQLFRAGTLRVVFDETDADKVYKPLRPTTHTHTRTHTRQLYVPHGILSDLEHTFQNASVMNKGRLGKFS